MAKKKRKEKREERKQRWVKKYRLVVFTEDSFEEKVSFKLTRLNVFVFGGVFSVLLVVFTACLIVYTSLKEYIPGFESPEIKKNAITLNFKLDSIQREFKILREYTEALKPVLLGDKAIEMAELPYVTKEGESVYQSGIINNDSILVKIQNLYEVLEQKNKTIENLRKNYNVKADTIASLISLDALNEDEKTTFSDTELELMEGSGIDSLLRENVEREERFSIYGDDSQNIEEVFIAPVFGRITDGFDPVSKHFAVDIVAPKGSPIKALADGMVIYSEWSIETGYVMVLLHKKNYVSVYKHNSKINASQGEMVKAGQVIANVGSTGDLSTGPHLHFEIWKDGYPVDPTNFLKFKQ